MSKYEVRKIVCDYGIYKNREFMLQLILRVKRHRNALTICDILKADDDNKVLALEERKHGHWNKDSDGL